MTVVIRHVRHRVAGPWPWVAQLMLTRCSLAFLNGGTDADREVHRPATSRCPRCYR